MPVNYREFTRPSLSGEGELFCRSWTAEAPRLIVLLLHGMCEHSGRYGRIASLLAENGCAVYAQDHLGHGRSTQGHPGTFSLSGHGFDYAMGDCLAGLDYASGEHPALRRVLLGHSMGSILAGLCADHAPRRLDGLILLGMPSPNPLSGLYAGISRAVTALRGPECQSELLLALSRHSTSGKQHASEFERKQWLSHNVEDILAYMNDPLAVPEFSSSAMGELAQGLRELGGKHWGEHIPRGLPVLVMGGGEDRGGGYGSAPRHYADQLRRCGVRDVTLQIVEGARHELLNEVNHSQTDHVILDWLGKRF